MTYASHQNMVGNADRVLNFQTFSILYQHMLLIYYGPKHQSESAIFNVTLDLRSMGI